MKTAGKRKAISENIKPLDIINDSKGGTIIGGITQFFLESV